MRQGGLTLVEALIAMLLVLAVSAAALAFVARGRDAQRAGESLARLEETLDDAFAALEDGIRMAGYLGLAPAGTAVAGAAPVGAPEPDELVVAGGCTPSLARDLAHPVAASDGAYEAAPGLPLDCRPSPQGRHVTGTDVLILRHAAAQASTPAAGRLQIESSLRAARLAADGVALLGAGARWHDLEAGAYYVSADSTGRDGWPSLRRKRLVGGNRPLFQDEELVTGISDLQLEFGIDEAWDADAAVDRWEPAPVSAPAGTLRALRLTLEARSDVAEAGQPGRSRSKRATRVIGLRNTGASR
ncbi:MAG TPA: PilW family protein [Steroidobacteraceae bacterium]|nr:PilW family protein [Steroidobacteraceae bacterium]